MHSYSDQLLLPYTHPHSEWCNLDSSQLYHSNLKSQPQDWYYRTHPVHYTWNSNGYRCAEWHDISWEHSRIIMGCSHAMGIGVTDQDTLAAHIPHAVNLAQPAVSVYHIQYNTLRLIDQGLQPLSVDILVPELSRAVYWAEHDWVDITAHDFHTRNTDLALPVQEYYRGLTAISPHAELMAWMTIRSIQALWQSHGVACRLWGLWFNSDIQYQHTLATPIDQARDLDPLGHAHPGRLTHQQWAQQIMAACQYP